MTSVAPVTVAGTTESASERSGDQVGSDRARRRRRSARHSWSAVAALVVVAAVLACTPGGGNMLHRVEVTIRGIFFRPLVSPPEPDVFQFP